MFSSTVGAKRADHDHLLLIVDDDEQLVELLGDLFQSAGYKIVPVHSGRQALDALGSNRAIALMLTDVRMPDMSGLELARHAAEKWPNVRIVMMSGYPTVPGHPWRFIAKPFRMAKLLAEIAAELSGAT